MNKKRSRLLQGIADGLSTAEAGRRAGFGTRQAAYKSLKLIRLNLPELLDKADLGVYKLLSGFKESLEATETKFFLSKTGQLIETPPRIAHGIRLKARIELAKWHGFYPESYDASNGDRAGGASRAPLVVVIADADRAAAISEQLRAAREMRAIPTGMDEARDADAG